MINQCKNKNCARNRWAGGLCQKHFREKHELEKSVEERCVKLAQTAGYLSWKFTVLNKVGVPDRIFIGHGRVFFVEFKRLNKSARVKQAAVIKLMRAHGAEVYALDSLAKFKPLLKV